MARQGIPMLIVLAALLSGCITTKPTSDTATVPVGTILAYAGEVDPIVGLPGHWRLCDGAVLRRTEYPLLCERIGTAWGDGDDNDVNTFRIPDLRGMFLRGVDHDANRDKSKDDQGRPAIRPGGNTGNRVGSSQNAATALPTGKVPFATSNQGPHTHRACTTLDPKGVLQNQFSMAWGAGGWRTWEPRPDGQLNGGIEPAAEHKHVVESGGDAETRPVNAGVNWIIRVE